MTDPTPDSPTTSTFTNAQSWTISIGILLAGLGVFLFGAMCIVHGMHDHHGKQSGRMHGGYMMGGGGPGMMGRPGGGPGMMGGKPSAEQHAQMQKWHDQMMDGGTTSTGATTAPAAPAAPSK